MKDLFKALLISEKEGKFIKEITQISTDQLPDNDLLIKASYSSINFKDALSASGNKGVTKKFPHVPGIDGAGIVVKSKVPEFAEGAEVLVTGFDLGMNTWGGFGEYFSVPASWAVSLPKELSLKEAMSFGTAGLTAGLSVNQLIKAGITPQKGEVAVSGATGGVGSIATAILAKLGFNVVTISGKQEEQFLLKTLGAKRIINRDDFTKNCNSKPLAIPIFAAGIDTVGGDILSGMLKSVKYDGIVSCCGMVASLDLHTSITPFILRSVHLAGIDSVQTDMNLRKQIWHLLANEWKPDNLGNMIEVIKMIDLPEKIDTMIQGKSKGRYVLIHN